MSLYLDANATEPLRPEAREAVLAALDAGGNPSSVHGAGRVARRRLEAAREAVTARCGRRLGLTEVVFTAGGTEANALAIHGLGHGRRVLVGATEHPAVLAAAPAASRLPVLPDGTFDLDALAAALSGGPPALVCAMAANNETGVLHPLAAIAVLCREHGALLHVDAVQAAGRVALPPGADSLALSGHKLGGPPGAGALLLRPGLDLPALIAGGGQERGRRGGTEPLPAIAGLAAALDAADPAQHPEAGTRLAALRDRIEAGLDEGVVIAGAGAPRLPNTSCILLPRVAAETQVIALDLAGVRVSAGAACSSGKVARSHVLEAMGFGTAAGSGIRISLPWNAAEDAPDRFLAAWAAMRARLA
ncbi:cysteine desulfurase [Siccirubricoccus deserti]|uniref:Cysteine desulfurase n=1 Tax=Siccirubricoccus deserti TaxID=2013562 RepID=A0A9X0QX88_9PROT|nr:aminotransferase class V-fold PLP-dependent enzyme [Siccirubricoccus deserti]MBC4014282.1 aminotransferase class V-fold PLP-dependent enzyme [Siccirubricoccus deserti]GGC28032.1 cysteine desulfurase [Siccirubricoccus deserti]